MYFFPLALLSLVISICAAQARPYGCFLQSNKPSVDDQGRVSSATNESEAQEIKFYSNSHSFVDEPLSKLKGALPELDGLKTDKKPHSLTDLLRKVASKTYELVEKMPSMICDESVTESQRPCLACRAFGPESGVRVEEYNYIILGRRAQQGHLVLEEYRTDQDGGPVRLSASPKFRGFSMFWVIFSESHERESHFRYLGQQKVDGRMTFVIAFAQIPGSVENPAWITAPKATVPMLLQGIAWIGAKDFRILRLHTDLLAPQPEIGYLKQTSELQYGPARIKSLKLDLWAPRTVNVKTNEKGGLWEEQHRYSKYRFYKAISRIILNPEN